MLLPDHLHAIWRLPDGDAETGKRWSLIKGQVTRASEAWLPPEPMNPSRMKRGEGGLWQRRFWERLLLDEADVEKHVEYIHYNPVKHGHVARVADWPYSTFHRYVASGHYPADWASAPDEAGKFGE